MSEQQSEQQSPAPMQTMILQMLGIGPDFADQVKVFITAFAEMKTAIERCEQKLDKIDYTVSEIYGAPADRVEGNGATARDL